MENLPQLSNEDEIALVQLLGRLLPDPIFEKIAQVAEETRMRWSDCVQFQLVTADWQKIEDTFKQAELGEAMQEVDSILGDSDEPGTQGNPEPRS